MASSKKAKAKTSRAKTPAAKVAAAKQAAAKPTKAEEAAVSPAPIEDEAPEAVGKGELRDSITHHGVYFPAGTKVSDVKPALSGDDKDRLERLGILA